MLEDRHERVRVNDGDVGEDGEPVRCSRYRRGQVQEVRRLRSYHGHASGFGVGVDVGKGAFEVDVGECREVELAHGAGSERVLGSVHLEL